jgi:glycosyltransferase 2 family protein
MSSSELPQQKPQSQSRRVLKILVQVVVMVAIFAALFWYVGVGDLYKALLNIRIEYLILAFLMYFGINVFFTIRLRWLLKKGGVQTTFGKTLLAQFAGMLTSDVTPGRSGYILTPVYLQDQKVPASKALSSILSIQTIEFVIKAAGAVLCAVFLLQFVAPGNWGTDTILGVNVKFFVIGLGIALMAVGASLLAALSWSERAISIFDRLANSRFLKRFTGGIMGKLEEYKGSAATTRSLIPQIFALSLPMWILKGFEWYFLALALNISFGTPVVMWLAFFLIHPLVTALAFVPITPAGAGVQEAGIVGILYLLFVSPIPPETKGAIAAFAILARALLIIEDLIGVPQIVKTTSFLVSRKKTQDSTQLPPTTPTL